MGQTCDKQLIRIIGFFNVSMQVIYNITLLLCFFTCYNISLLLCFFPHVPSVFHGVPEIIYVKQLNKTFDE